MKIKTIRARITIWFSILFLILSGGIMLFLFLVGHDTMQDNTRDRLRALVNDNLDELEFIEEDEDTEFEEGDYFFPWKDGILEIDDDFRRSSGGISVSLYDGTERLFGKSPIDAGPEVLPFAEGQIREIHQGGRTYLVYDAAVYEDDLEGLWLRGIVNKSEDVPTIYRIGRMMLVILPILTLIAIYGGYHLARQALKPLGEISEQASSIGSGSDLSRRVEIQTSSEETSRLVKAFNDMLERLQNSFEAEKQFTSDASHELRTPVAVILAECEYALDETDSAEWLDALRVIYRQGTKMSDMIEELLAFTRLEQRTMNLKWEDVNLTELALEVCKEQELIRDKNITMHTELETPFTVQGDRGLLERMIRNLVVNAYQYGKEQGNVYVKTYEEDGHVVLSVRDDGIGIREEELPNIWKRFYRADNVRKTKSTGLGLSFVQEIASIHHAQIKVFSKINEGSTFLIFF